MRLIWRRDLPINFLIIALASSVNVFFGFLKLLDLLGVRFYYFYSAKVVNIVIFSASLDWSIWLISSIIILSEIFALIFFRKSLPRWIFGLCLFEVAAVSISLIDAMWAVLFGVFLGFVVVGVLVYFGFGYTLRRSVGFCFMLMGIVIFVIFLGFASLVTWVWNIFDYSFPFVDGWRWRYALVDLNLFSVFYGWTPWLFVALLYSWLWIPLSKFVAVKVRTLRSYSERITFNNIFGFVKLSRKMLVAGLLAIVGVAVFVSGYPYFNLASSSLVGSDSAVYYKWLGDMSVNGPAIALQKDRPLSDLLMYFIQHAFGLSTEAVVKVMPVLCCIGLSLAVFWFVRVGLRNDVLALVSGTVYGF